MVSSKLWAHWDASNMDIGMAERFGRASRGEGLCKFSETRDPPPFSAILRSQLDQARSDLGRLSHDRWAPKKPEFYLCWKVGASQRLAVRASQPSQLIIATLPLVAFPPARCVRVPTCPAGGLMNSPFPAADTQALRGSWVVRLSGHGTEALDCIINPAANERLALDCVGLACPRWRSPSLRTDSEKPFPQALVHALQPWDPKGERRAASICAGGKRSLTRCDGQWFAAPPPHQLTLCRPD